MTRFAMLAGAVSVLVWAVSAAAETQVELKQVHMCCSRCAKEVVSLPNLVEGIEDVTCGQKARKARFTAADKAAQRALDALVEAVSTETQRARITP